MAYQSFTKGARPPTNTCIVFLLQLDMRQVKATIRAQDKANEEQRIGMGQSNDDSVEKMPVMEMNQG